MELNPNLSEKVKILEEENKVLKKALQSFPVKKSVNKNQRLIIRSNINCIDSLILHANADIAHNCMNYSPDDDFVCSVAECCASDCVKTHTIEKDELVTEFVAIPYHDVRNGELSVRELIKTQSIHAKVSFSVINEYKDFILSTPGYLNNQYELCLDHNLNIIQVDNRLSRYVNGNLKQITGSNISNLIEKNWLKNKLNGYSLLEYVKNGKQDVLPLFCSNHEQNWFHIKLLQTNTNYDNVKFICLLEPTAVSDNFNSKFDTHQIQSYYELNEAYKSQNEELTVINDELKALNSKLEANEKKANDYIMQSPICICVLTKVGIVLKSNLAFQQWLGTSENFIKDTHFEKLFKKADNRVISDLLIKKYNKGISLELTNLKGETFTMLADTAEVSGEHIMYLRNITAYNQIKSIQEESEKQYKSLFEDNHSIMLIINPDNGKILDANKAAILFYGFDLVQLTSMKISQINVMNENDIRKEMKKAEKEKRNYFIFNHKRADNSICTVEVYSGPVSYKGKDVLYSIIHDISDRIYAENELKKSERRFRLLIHKSPYAIIIVDLNGNVYYLNYQFEILFNKDLQNVKHLDELDNFRLIHKNKKTRLSEIWSEVSNDIKLNKEINPYYTQLRTNKNSEKDLEVTFTPIGNRILIVLNDLTQLNKTHRKLKEIENKFSRIFETTPLPISISSLKNGEFYDVNRSFIEVTGYKREELIGKTSTELNFFKDANFGNKLIDILKKDGRVINMEVEFLKKNGELRIFLMSAELLEIKGSPFLISVIQDITAIKEAELQLINAKLQAEEADKLKSAFLANMSHEIRTPLNGMLGFAELLRDDAYDNETKNKFIDIISGNGNQLLHIISDIIDIAKIEANQIKIFNEEFDLNALLNDIHYMYQSGSQIHKNPDVNIFLTTVSALNHSTIKADRNRLQQVITNLLNNAFKFTKEGHISFGYELAENHLEFFVSDTGSGIPEDKKELVFERFGQVETEDSRKKGGTGLGLPICKALIEKMGGNIWVETNESNGSTFKFTLPLVFAEKKGTLNTPVGDNVNWKGKTILIAEDEDINFMLIESILAKTEICLLHAKNGKECIDIFKQNKVDVILMDVKMPLMSGFEAVDEIRKINKKIPIIAQTAYAMIEDKNNCIKKGCDDYLSKPIKRDELLQKLSNYL